MTALSIASKAAINRRPKRSPVSVGRALDVSSGNPSVRSSSRSKCDTAEGVTFKALEAPASVPNRTVSAKALNALSDGRGMSFPHVAHIGSHYRIRIACARIMTRGHYSWQKAQAMLKAHFDQLAAYNRWANRKVYADAATLPDDIRKRPEGLFFGSIHGTLNHLLVADYIWMRRFTGDGPAPERLNQILHEDFSALRQAREAEDERILGFVTNTTNFDRVIEYNNSSGKTFRQEVGPALAHLFNHQAHHRG
jgi:uncharacterized damage-inducible protein DinB